MEGFNYERYRNDLAKRIKETGPEKRQDYLKAEKILKAEYNLAWVKHDTEKHNLKKDKENIDDIIRSSFVPKSDEFKSSYNGYLGEYFTKFKMLIEMKNNSDVSKESLLHYEAWKSIFDESFTIFQEKLKGSTLIDLGCGGVSSLRNSYTFARLFECKKYVGVDKKFQSDGETLNIDELKDKMYTQKNKYFNTLCEDKLLPKNELIEKEMLDFISSYTERSNVMVNGIDGYIKPFSKEYDKKLIEHIARLVPQGGIVFGVNNSFLGDLINQGFEYKEVRHLGLSLYI